MFGIYELHQLYVETQDFMAYEIISCGVLFTIYRKHCFQLRVFSRLKFIIDNSLRTGNTLWDCYFDLLLISTVKLVFPLRDNNFSFKPFNRRSLEISRVERRRCTIEFVQIDSQSPDIFRLYS